MWENIEQIMEIINNSFSKSEILRKLGLKLNGGNYNTLSHFIMRNKIDVSHFKNTNSIINFNKYEKIEDILVENSLYTSTNHLKERLYKEGFKERKCEECGQDENWNGKKISLILDHINGDRHDNRLDNLRIVCPNCNASLETHCRGLNIKNKNYYNLCDCGNKKRIESKTCFECFKQNKVSFKKEEIKKTRKETRKVIRPSYKELIILINELGYKEVGRRYNVSDNSIRKWKKMYEKYGDNF